MTPNVAPLISVRLEGDDSEEIVEFSAADVLAHNEETRSWEQIASDAGNSFAQESMAEDYALFRFKRKYGDHGDYHVTVLAGLTDVKSKADDSRRHRVAPT